MENLIKEILHKENIGFEKIIKATSGFTNLVYFIDDKYVIKMSNADNIKKKLTKETSIYKNINLNFIPKYVASGAIKNYQYLIISKVKGKSLYSIWHALSKEERQNCVKQIAKIIKEFNKQDYTFLSDEYKHFDRENILYKQLKEKSLLLAKIGFNTKKLDDFIELNLHKLFNKNKFCLIYNDAHFDNFIYNNGILYLIDFDRVMVAPIDCEMLIFKTMCDNPSKFASEEDEDKIINEDYKEIYTQFKTEYKEMFNDNNVEKRIATYQFNYLIEQAIKSKNTDWTKNLLTEFNK